MAQKQVRKVRHRVHGKHRPGPPSCKVCALDGCTGQLPARGEMRVGPKRRWGPSAPGWPRVSSATAVTVQASGAGHMGPSHLVAEVTWQESASPGLILGWTGEEVGNC